MTYPTISISLSTERTNKLRQLLRLLREEDETISRSEIVGIAIDALHASKCPLENTLDQSTVQEQAAA